MSNAARAWLQSTAHARVLHWFDEVCNLLSDEGCLLSVVSERISDGPFSLVVPRIRFSERISASATIAIDNENLRLGEIEIDWRSARIWDARPDWPGLRAQREIVLAGVQEVVATLLCCAPGGSLAGLITNRREPRSPLAKELQRQVREPAFALASGLRCRDGISSGKAAARLVGLGTGLTPSGDDWLVGCLLGSWIVWDDDEAADLARAAARPLAGKTTPLSMAMIRAAARGECGADWHLLFQALSAADRDSVRRISERIITHGHTSGADALAGFAAVLGITTPG